MKPEAEATEATLPNLFDLVELVGRVEDAAPCVGDDLSQLQNLGPSVGDDAVD